MPSMTKRVNVTTTIPVRTITPPLNGTYKDIIMSTGDILKCISRRAIVDEILPNGMAIRLTIGNYYKDNGAGLDAAERAAGMKITDEENIDLSNEEDEIVTPPTQEEEQAPEVPAETEDVVDGMVKSNTDNKAEGEEETPVVETENDETEPEASVEPDADAEAAQVTEEPPVVKEAEVDTEAEAAESANEEKQTAKKTTSKKGSSSKKGITKKIESTVEAAAETESVE